MRSMRAVSAAADQSLWRSALIRTANTTVFLVITMLILNTIIYLLGADSLAAILLQGSRLQPVLCALIGLIPGCAVSVLLVQLFTAGTISFGSVIAGLSAGAGFGFILLLREAPCKKSRLADYRLHVCGSRCGGTADRLYYINDCLSNDIPLFIEHFTGGFSCLALII